MVGYYEILPYAKPVEFTLGAQTWLLDDQHCVRAKCSCQEAALSFFELRPSAQYSGIGSEPTLCIRKSRLLFPLRFRCRASGSNEVDEKRRRKRAP
jgi:hypothetical protein